MTEKDFIINCPHCNILIYVEKLNCGVFRCGIIKKSMQQIPPHADEKTCLKFKSNNQIYGCGNPFRIKNTGSEFIIEKCDYDT